MSSRELRAGSWEERVVGRLFSLKRRDESDAAFARRLGLQPQHLSNYRNGHHGLSLRTAIRVAEGTGISLDWLLLGRGKPDGGIPEARPAPESRTAREA
ncbi:MAG TPA: helix-turn-helix transcriptional regulator [Gemmatimonadota bacterium]|nr:helix-turn-helix transcriptional regulator [Gemmatimonadota bacterium]